jgi:glucosamine kinase
MALIAGFDGGGSKTLVALCHPDGSLAGLGHSGPGNLNDVGAQAVQANLVAGLEQALQQAGASIEQVSHAFLGLAGLVSSRENALALELAQKVLPHSQLGIDNDGRIALAGSLAGRAGLVLIAGTGSACYGVNASGRTWRAGGWGHLFSDEGSSHWLGRQGLRAVACAADGRGPTTALTSSFLQHLGIDHTDLLLHRVYIQGLSRSEVAALAPLVVAAAEAGDPVALELLDTGAYLLAECVMATAEQLQLGPSPELAVVGGLTQAGEVFWQPLRRALMQELPAIQLIKPQLPPVLGAVLLAQPQPSPQWIEHLHQASKLLEAIA